MKEDLIKKTPCYSVDEFSSKTGRLKFRASKYLTILVRKDDGYHIYNEPGSAKNSAVEGSDVIITETGVKLRIRLTELEVSNLLDGGVIKKEFKNKDGKLIKTKYLCLKAEKLVEYSPAVMTLKKKTRIYAH